MEKRWIALKFSPRYVGYAVYKEHNGRMHLLNHRSFKKIRKESADDFASKVFIYMLDENPGNIIFCTSYENGSLAERLYMFLLQRRLKIMCERRNIEIESISYKNWSKAVDIHENDIERYCLVTASKIALTNIDNPDIADAICVGFSYKINSEES